MKHGWDNSTLSHHIFVYQTQKLSVLQEIASDEDIYNQNSDHPSDQLSDLPKHI